ncbi:hypothetical protein J3D54_004168 [Pseudomonas sp. GGS8]|uniref:hypothetical protein n=1 Tax=Pseudomonas sp. GGS8 TaxID=2817892 RepID=UPI00209EC156|nr:hypothetical protein [Pseudomonas sp. GGS8]MCP1445036.1 hypothetical protein [Pseudomonas sp. GGS8]
MDHLLGLKVVDQERTESLRERMDAAGCVFEFVVVSLGQNSLIDEAMHRLALNALYEQIMASQFDWHRKLIRKLPCADYPEPSMTWALDRAIATPLSRAEVRNLTLTEDYQHGPLALYSHFREPPYLTQFEGGEAEAEALFREWLELLGVEDRDDVVALNWVKGGNSGVLRFSVNSANTTMAASRASYFGGSARGCSRYSAPAPQCYLRSKSSIFPQHGKRCFSFSIGHLFTCLDLSSHAIQNIAQDH